MSLSMRPEFVASATRAAVIVRSHFSSGHVGPSVLAHCASSDIPPSDSDSGRTSLRQVLHTHWGNRGEAVLKPLGGRLWASWGPLGSLLGLLGGLLGPPGGLFGRKARIFGSWSPSWAPFGAVLGLSWAESLYAVASYLISLHSIHEYSRAFMLDKAVVPSPPPSV